MKKSDSEAFWIGVISAAFLSFILYRLLRPRTIIAPEPLIVTRDDFPPPEMVGNTGSEKDPLTNIRGIGPATESAMNKAGIYSFSQLAAADLADIQAFTGNRWNAADWIDEANNLSSS